VTSSSGGHLVLSADINKQNSLVVIVFISLHDRSIVVIRGLAINAHRLLRYQKVASLPQHTHRQRVTGPKAMLRKRKEHMLSGAHLQRYQLVGCCNSRSGGQFPVRPQLYELQQAVAAGEAHPTCCTSGVRDTGADHTSQRETRYQVASSIWIALVEVPPLELALDPGASLIVICLWFLGYEVPCR